MTDPGTGVNTYPRVVIAGLKGGSGKTTLTLGLLAAIRGRGMRPAAFKKGPDYIDAAWLAAAAGGPCYNLDPFLIGEENIVPSFFARAAGADVSIIEGNRGIFDGMDLDGSQSTARLARMLDAPVVLVLDVSKMTRTAAALVLGVLKFDPALVLGGVVLNQVAGARHEAMLRATIESYTGVPVLGAVPRVRSRERAGLLSERHMGLTAYQEYPEAGRALDEVSKLIAGCVDVEGVLRIARQPVAKQPVARQPAQTVAATPPPEGRKKIKTAKPVIGVLRDEAFQFYYPENLETLGALGASLVFFSPLKMSSIPFPDIDALYIGGGFPETHVEELSANRAFLRVFRARIEEGLPVYAECGGLMYLTSYLEIFPFSITIEKRPVAHGYSLARVCADNAFYPAGTILKGHEFHYSRLARLDGNGGPDGDVSFALKMERGTGIEDGMDGLVYKNVFATYTHTHVLGTPEWAHGMIAAAKKFRRTRSSRKMQ